MKKALKWTLIIIGGLIVLILAAAFIIPIVFKDDIVAAINKEINKSVNADVVYDVEKFDITLFKNFPNITAEMRDKPRSV
jgi:flagellar basal body-associated protein FliL